MAEPQMLRACDARAVFHLLGECLEQWDDGPAWREHFLSGAAQLIGGRVAAWLAAGVGDSRGVSVASIGLDDRQEKQAYLSLLEQPMDVVLPGVPDYVAEHIHEGVVTCRLSDLVERREWQCSIGFNEHHRPANCDVIVVSGRVVASQGKAEFIGISRPIGERAFTMRDRNVLDYLHRELADLVGERLATEDQIGRHGLTRRQRHTLDGLLLGLTEREIARRLGISPTTVHTYVGMLYEHFGVKSRSELLSYYVARRPQTAANGRD